MNILYECVTMENSEPSAEICERRQSYVFICERRREDLTAISCSLITTSVAGGNKRGTLVWNFPLFFCKEQMLYEGRMLNKWQICCTRCMLVITTIHRKRVLCTRHFTRILHSGPLHQVCSRRNQAHLPRLCHPATMVNRTIARRVTNNNPPN